MYLIDVDNCEQLWNCVQVAHMNVVDRDSAHHEGQTPESELYYGPFWSPGPGSCGQTG